MTWDAVGGTGEYFANGEGGASLDGYKALTAHDLDTGGEPSLRKRKRQRGTAKDGRSRSLEARAGRPDKQSRFRSSRSASRRREYASERLSYDEFKAVADAFRWWKKVDAEQKREERHRARAALNWVKATEFWNGATLKTRFHRWRLTTRAFRSKKRRLCRYVHVEIDFGDFNKHARAPSLNDITQYEPHRSRREWRLKLRFDGWKMYTREKRRLQSNLTRAVHFWEGNLSAISFAKWRAHVEANKPAMLNSPSLIRSLFQWIAKTVGYHFPALITWPQTDEPHSLCISQYLTSIANDTHAAPTPTGSSWRSRAYDAWPTRKYLCSHSGRSLRRCAGGTTAGFGCPFRRKRCGIP